MSKITIVGDSWIPLSEELNNFFRDVPFEVVYTNIRKIGLEHFYAVIVESEGKLLVLSKVSSSIVTMLDPTYYPLGCSPLKTLVLSPQSFLVLFSSGIIMKKFGKSLEFYRTNMIVDKMESSIANPDEVILLSNHSVYSLQLGKVGLTMIHSGSVANITVNWSYLLVNSVDGRIVLYANMGDKWTNCFSSFFWSKISGFALRDTAIYVCNGFVNMLSVLDDGSIVSIIMDCNSYVLLNVEIVAGPKPKKMFRVGEGFDACLIVDYGKVINRHRVSISGEINFIDQVLVG